MHYIELTLSKILNLFWKWGKHIKEFLSAIDLNLFSSFTNAIFQIFYNYKTQSKIIKCLLFQSITKKSFL